MSYPKIMDAAIPPGTAPDDVNGVMGYIGGDAVHVWTLAEWQRFAHLAQFPVWVMGGSTDPAGDAHRAVGAAVSLAWAPHMPEPGNRVIIADMEATIDAEWYDAWAAVVTAEGFTPACYGSLSTVLENAAELVIAADWVGGSVLPPVPAGQTIAGLQWEANVPVGTTMVDYSVFTPALFARGGVGARRAL